MKGKTDFVLRGELAARITTQEWIRQALRESFLQALKQAWKIRHKETENSGIQVELSLSGVNACFAFVERVSRAWQIKLKEEQHERVARWVEQVYQQGKSSLWAEQMPEENDDSDDHLSIPFGNDQLLPQQFEKKSSSDQDIENLSASSMGEDDMTQKTDKAIDDGGDDEGEVASTLTEENDIYDSHPNVYCKLRALGRRSKIDSPVLSIPDGLQELKEFTRNQPIYGPLTNDVIDQACSDISRRMRARDKHGSGGSGNDKSYTKKTVRFKVLPKSVWETKQQQERNQTESHEPMSDGDENSESNETTSSSVETVLLASMKRKKSESRSHAIVQTSRKKSRISEQQETSRIPFDVPNDGRISMDLSLKDKKVLDGLLILDDEDGDANSSQATTASLSAIPLGLFGGLQHVGETNHLVQNPGTGSGRAFMAKDSDKITRRREKVSIQERLDPNRIQVGRTEDPTKRKSKILRTEDWFDDQKKFFEFDLGWCLLEIPIEKNQKRLCAFSSMEICLEDSDN